MGAIIAGKQEISEEIRVGRFVNKIHVSGVYTCLFVGTRVRNPGMVRMMG